MTEGSYTNTNFHVRITLNCNLNLNLLICFWMKGLIFCMEKYIGIIVAEIEELEAIKSLMYNIEEVHIYNLNIFKGKISNKDCLLVRCGVGKVNASRITQILTDNFKLEFIINLGSAGSLNNDLNIGDIVIAKNLVQHDFDVTAFGRDKGYIPDTGMFFECDNSLLQKCVCIEIDNIKLYSLNNKIFNDENDNSLVLYTKINNTKILFTGDASLKTEEFILKNYNLEEVDILKVAHHGSSTSSGIKFLEKIKPKISIVSSGKNNRYNHPNDSVVNRLKKYGTFYNTAENGTVEIVINKTYKIYNYSP